MKSRTLTYRIPGATWCLRFSAETIELLTKEVQTGASSKESVGQLYARDLTQGDVEVSRVTKLKPTWARFARVKFDPKLAMVERTTFLASGFHCIGLWHTHPEPKPVPSSEDVSLAKEHALAAKSQLTGLVFVIVGTAPFPLGLQVWVHDGERLLAALPLEPLTD